MSERALVFHAESVHGIQRAKRRESGAKWQARCVAKLPKWAEGELEPYHGQHGLQLTARSKKSGNMLVVPPPIWRGDVVRVKEAFVVHEKYDHWPGLDQVKFEPEVGCLHYLADGEKRNYHGRTRSPTLMPRWASRYWLPIVSVRCERVQDISEADAEAEGFYGCDEEACMVEDLRRPKACGYAQVFERINGRGSWAANPWVWVYEWAEVRVTSPQNVSKTLDAADAKSPAEGCKD